MIVFGIVNVLLSGCKINLFFTSVLFYIFSKEKTKYIFFGIFCLQFPFRKRTEKEFIQTDHAEPTHGK